MLRAMTLFTADNLNKGIFPKCDSLTIVRESYKIKSIWFGASTASLLSESARWTMPIFLVDARWGCRACCGKLSRLGGWLTQARFWFELGCSYVTDLGQRTN
jgi:hypothetical protein